MRWTDGRGPAATGLVRRLAAGSFPRFFLASLAGLVFDVALASVLHHWIGVPLLGAAAVSLVCAASVMYVIHEFWTFGSSVGRFSAPRMLGTVGSALLALAVRSGCLYGTSMLLGLGESLALFQILLAVGASFTVNFLVVRRIVGRAGSR